MHVQRSRTSTYTYDAQAGRWTSKDPIGFAGGSANFYTYVLADPLNSIDPKGLYGTNDCSYYKRRCRESGGEYYCTIAPFFCDKVFPKYPDPDPSRDDDYEGWTRCTRKCLQDCDEAGTPCQDDPPRFPDPGTDEFWDIQHLKCHVKCYTECFVGGLQ